MSNVSTRCLRLRVLAAATAVALSSLAAAPAFAGGPDLSGLQSDTSFDQFIVKYRNGSAERTSTSALQSSLGRAARALPADANGRALGVSLKRRMSLGRDVIRSDRKLDRVEAAVLMQQIAADPNVESVEIDVMMRALATPDDTRYGEQWHYYETTGGLNLPVSWDKSTGAGVVVAVIDTGIISHADLNANILPGYDFITSTASGNGGSGDGNGRDSDPTAATGEAHGTHVAGTIAAVTNNGSGVSGVAYHAKVVPVRVLGNGGFGTTSDIVDAIVWASGGTVSGVPANANPAEVINLSLGGATTCTSTSAYQTAINGAVSRGTTVVVAAGNSNTDVAGFSPAGCNNVIAVAASDKEGDRAWYSNYGARIDVTAPGGETCSPAVRFLALGVTPTAQHCAQQSHPAKGILSTVGGGLYSFYQGTSMAAPHVAGVVALIQSAAATPLTPAQVETTLKNTVRAIPADNCPGGCGAGFVNVDAAITAVTGGGGNVAPVANFTSSANGLTVNFTDTSTDSDGSIASRSWNFGDGTTSSAASPSKTYSAAGTYTVTLTVTDNGGATGNKASSVTVSSGGNGAQTYSNTTDYTINDNSTVDSPITVSGRSGNGPSNTSITVDVRHTYRGDLKVDVVAPDGTLYNLHNRTGGSADNVTGTFTKNLTSEALNGTWRLRVNDNATLDTGYINSWSITF